MKELTSINDDDDNDDDDDDKNNNNNSFIHNLYFLQIGDSDEHGISLQHNHINTQHDKYEIRNMRSLYKSILYPI